MVGLTKEVFGKTVPKCPEVCISIHGQQVRVILDTGSEVTVLPLPEATFQSLSSKKPALQDVTRWLKVYGVNGIEIPLWAIICTVGHRPTWGLTQEVWESWFPR